MPKYVELLFDVPLKQSFTYQVSEKGDESVGKRVIAPFGRRELTGFVIAERDVPPLGVEESRIKQIRRVVDKEPLFGPDEIELSRWLSAYYFCTQGEALAAMLPSGRRASSYTSFGADDLEEGYDGKGLSLSGEQETALRSIIGTVGGAEDTAGRSATEEAGAGGSRVDDMLSASRTALSPVLKSAPPYKTYYLYGITGSGKTEVFLRAAEHFVRRGKSLIYLVPEISLTHQAAEAIGKRFGTLAATLHSGMSGSERLSEWMRIKRGEVQIVVGPRSAVFSPVRDLALVIIDEEHDASFKSGNTPRYHARQVAMRRCARTGASLLMGSATPSAEAWKLMSDGLITRLDLTKRLSGGSVPEIKIVSLEHTDGCLSYELKEEIRKTALAKRQTILFLNRRGFAYFYHCKDCGFELLCKHCSVSLTWHKARGKAVCHYCGYQSNPPSACPSCGSLSAGFMGFGTEMIEEEVRRAFPDLRVTRLDTDSVQKKGSLEAALASFRAGAVDILLGTQMVAKGLNFPGVRLVGVVFADTGLHLPDFRAAERTFSLIVQVAGRAGRFFPDGKVLVQTLRPHDEVIRKACALDVEAFFKAELEQRKEQEFPPYSRLIRVLSRSRDAGRADNAIHRFRQIVEGLLPRGADMLGPAECPLSIVAGNHRRHILLRGTDMGALHSAVRRGLDLYEVGKDARVYLELDVDPVSLL
ncbi:MAG: primosomal protein N' [Spirochaetaceae bacterium]|jgi:primosomal protein N' (replication factor Y)|nr:primosomal protein N' [Spirochaetaceae bacterium]